MSQVLDYSAGFPGAQAIKRAGYVGAVRYIGFPDRRKCTNQGEFADFDNHQIGMALVFENNTTDWRGGFGAGLVSGRRGRDHANAIGFPADRPIYMATDQDVVSSGEFATMVEYLRGAGTSLGGPAVTGVYGEADVIDRARDAGVASWFWQTAAWSRSRRTKAHLFQHVGAVNVGGIACDINDALSDDWGQHNAKEGGMSAADAEEGTRKYFRGTSQPNVENAAGGERSLEQVVFVTNEWVNEALILLRGLSGALAGVRGELLAALAQIEPSEPVSEEQLQRLITGLRTGLGDELAEDIGRRLLGHTEGN